MSHVHASAEQTTTDDICKQWITALAKVANGELGPAPQLSPVQLGLIAADLNAIRHQKRAPVNFLVFGVGHDSVGWAAVNCHGRTVFLEGHEGWLNDITAKNPQLEAYKVTYRGDMRKAEDFFTKPWLMDLPENITNTCWDSILVDAPQGYDPSQGHPGRMESSYAALELARKCLQAENRPAVTIWLHDVDRPVEQQIIQKLFDRDPWVKNLGTFGGGVGMLGGFVMLKPNWGSNLTTPSLGSRSSRAVEVEQQLQRIQYILVALSVVLIAIATFVFRHERFLRSVVRGKLG